MKTTLRKFLALSLLAIMLLSLFVACTKKDDGNKDDGTGEITGTDENPNLPAKDFEEYEFTFITQEGAAYNTGYLEFMDEEGEILDSAIGRRNALLEEKYNVKIRQLRVSDIITEVRAQVMGGATDFDVILASCGRLATMAQENLLYNLLDIKTFDWEKSYWDSNSKDQLMIGDKLYFANCALNIHSIGFCVFFNKKIVEDYELTSPYEYIENNEWTIDNWAKMVKSVSKDMDNDGKMTEFDQYGTLAEHHNPRMFLYASGVRATTNDENGYPQLTLMKDADKTVNIYEKLKAVLGDESVSYCMDCSQVDAHGFAHKYSYLRSLFTQDLYMFHYTSQGALGEFSEMESDFGVVPFPKYNQQQEKYQTIYPYNNNLLAIPSTMEGEDLERTAVLLEDMNYFSSFTVVPAWFDTLLSRRYARDDESEESLHILRDNCVYDIGLYYDFGNLRQSVLDVDFATSNIARNYARYEKGILASIKKVYSNFEQFK